jgi:hypothetical protein
MEAAMNDETGSTLESVQGAAHAVADGVSEAAGRAVTGARKASDGVTEFRTVIREQPITMAFLMLGIGYVLGRMFGGDGDRGSRRNRR